MKGQFCPPTRVRRYAGNYGGDEITYEQNENSETVTQKAVTYSPTLSAPRLSGWV